MFRKVWNLPIVFVLLLGGVLSTGPAAAQEPIPNIEARVPADAVAVNLGPDVQEVRLEVYSPGETVPKCENTFTEIQGEEEVQLDCWEGYVLPGDTIKLYINGEAEPVQVHQVIDISLDVFDPQIGRFAGTLNDDVSAWVSYCDPEPDGLCGDQDILVEPDNTWTVDFGHPIDPEAWFAAYASDQNGNLTMVSLTPTPYIDFNNSYNWMTINHFPGYSQVDVTIYTNDGTLEETVETDGYGFVGWDVMTDLPPGSTIFASSEGEEVVRELEVAELSLDFIDFEGDQAGGAAAEGAQVHFVLEGPETYLEDFVTAGSEGWLVDFGPDYGIDLVEEMGLWVFIEDEDGDQTLAELVQEEPPAPGIDAYPLFDFVNAWFFPLGQEVTLIIKNEMSQDAEALYIDSATSAPSPYNPEETLVSFDLRPFDLQAGQWLIMVSPDAFQVHQVFNLTLDSVDEAEDLVAGTADPYSEVMVSVNYAPGGDILTTADAAGHWVADYSGQYDLVYGDLVIASRQDESGNNTIAERLIVTPGGLVDEIQNMPDELVSPEIKNSLIKKVENAYSSYLKGNQTAAINKLEALINEIDAQVGNKVDPDLVSWLHMLVHNLIREFQE